MFEPPTATQKALAAVTNHFLITIHLLNLISKKTYYGFTEWDLVSRFTESRRIGKLLAEAAHKF